MLLFKEWWGWIVVLISQPKKRNLGCSSSARQLYNYSVFYSLRTLRAPVYSYIYSFMAFKFGVDTKRSKNIFPHQTPNLGIQFLDDMICKLGRLVFVCNKFFFGLFFSSVLYLLCLRKTNKQTVLQTSQERKKYLYFHFLLIQKVIMIF